MMQLGSRLTRILLALAVALAMSASAVAAQTFTVTPFQSQDYVINGDNDPTLTLTRGQVYTFNVNASGHPFWIKTARSTGSTNRYDNGVTNNGDDVGTVTFTVPLDAPSTLFYNCGVHAAMGGTINIIDASTPTRTATASPSRTPTRTRTPTTSPSPTATPDLSFTCTGDCDGDSSVTVDDLVALVNSAEPPDCPHGVPAGSPVDEALLVTALTNALGQCDTGG